MDDVWLSRDRVRVFAHSARVADGELHLTGRIYAKQLPANLRFSVRKFREAGTDFEIPFEAHELSPRKWGGRGWAYWYKFGLKTWAFEGKVDVAWSDLTPSIYSIEIVHDAPKSIIAEPVKRRGLKPHRGFKELLAPVKGDDTTLHLFVDDISNILRFEVFNWASVTLKELQDYAQARPKKTGPPVCVIGEYSFTAKDNGKRLFDGLREADLGVEAIYSIERDNDAGLQAGQQGVVEFGSKEHLLKCIEASVLAFSHSKSFVFPHVMKKIAPQRYHQVKLFWLQHGVTALKKSVIGVYKKKRANFDFIAVSSPLEKSIFEKRFGYKSDQAKITGFSRYDRLHRISQQTPREDRILFFPTWRRGLLTLSETEFRESLYFTNWIKAIAAVRRRTDMWIVMMVHPLLEHYADLYRDHADEVQFSSRFQQEVTRSSCLITDFSSVCFDALYAGKPAAFFHFDADEYGFQEEAMIDIGTQMPGPIANTPEELAGHISGFQENGWSADGSTYQKMYFSNVDQNNVARIAKIIRSTVD